jgi:DNA-binding HxlR family transcriptional regulator
MPRVRAGAQALSLLAVPLSANVLSALKEEPKPLMVLRREVGLPPQTTMRGQLRTLTRTSVLERQQEGGFPGAVQYALGPAGEDLLVVARALQTWLERSPDGPVLLGSAEAKNRIKTLAQGWSSTIMRALASGPLSLTDLNRLISGLNYPSLERRLGALRATGMIESCPSETRTTPYRASTWLRQAIAPLAAAARWERLHVPEETTPIGRIDIEAAFLLTLPMLDLPAEIDGGCRLAVEARNLEPDMAGVTCRFAGGRLESCIARLQGKADAGACGTAIAWIDAVEDADPARLEIRGNRDLPLAILQGLRGFLLPVRSAAGRKVVGVGNPEQVDHIDESVPGGI